MTCQFLIDYNFHKPPIYTIYLLQWSLTCCLFNPQSMLLPQLSWECLWSFVCVCVFWGRGSLQREIQKQCFSNTEKSSESATPAFQVWWGLQYRFTDLPAPAYLWCLIKVKLMQLHRNQIFPFSCLTAILEGWQLTNLNLIGVRAIIGMFWSLLIFRYISVTYQIPLFKLFVAGV